MRKESYVVAMPYPFHSKLPDILEEEDGNIMYFNNKKEAINFIQNLYDERNLNMKALIDDTIDIMRVQWRQ